jgi:glutamine synthetase type III
MIMNRYRGYCNSRKRPWLGANEAPPAIICVYWRDKVLAELEGVTQEIVSRKNRFKLNVVKFQTFF